MKLKLSNVRFIKVNDFMKLQFELDAVQLDSLKRVEEKLTNDTEISYRPYKEYKDKYYLDVGLYPWCKNHKYLSKLIPYYGDDINIVLECEKYHYGGKDGWNCKLVEYK